MRTSLRAIPDSFATQTVAEIDRRLNTICEVDDVAIPLAIESGSRAWGFPSPDSDYDCRFVFVRPVDQHLSPWPFRDVIETPLEGELDVNGWELGKALRLVLKGNAVIIEWLRSPCIYRGEAWFRDRFLALASQFADRNLIGRHYLHLGQRQRRVHFGDAKRVPQKKIFYALRPAAALRWMRLHPDQAIAPMHFPTLMSECEAPRDVAEITAELLQRKAITRELGAQPLAPAIATFIDQEFEIARPIFEGKSSPVSDEAKREAAKFYKDATFALFRLDVAPP